MDPFEKKEHSKVNIAAKLDYAGADENTFRCKLRSIRQGESSNAEEWQQTRAIANFISHINWTSDLKEEGGITWLELYVWYRMHSKEVVEDPLAITKPLMNDIAKFKSLIRRVATYCTDEGEEWVLNTCYGRGNRPKKAAIGNKHAAIQGMPRIPDIEAEQVMRTILMMKGTVTNKHREAHEQGSLSASKATGVQRNSKALVHPHGKNDGWAIEGANLNENEPKQTPLSCVFCPKCEERTSTRCMKLKARSIFPI